MAKTVYLTMRINAVLKAKLQALADEDYRILSDFIETHLHQTASSSKANRKSLEVTAPKATLKSQIARQERTARLTMRINSQLKDKLRKLARKQYPTLTDFIETELYRIAAAPKEIWQKTLAAATNQTCLPLFAHEPGTQGRPARTRRQGEPQASRFR